MALCVYIHIYIYDGTIAGGCAIFNAPRKNITNTEKLLYYIFPFLALFRKFSRFISHFDWNAFDMQLPI